MNRSHLSVMTLFDHRAAGLELIVLYGYMVRFERICQRGGWFPARVRTAIERIYGAVHRLHQEMRQVQELTRAENLRRSTCWRESEEARPTPILRQRGTAMTMDEHAAAARELGQAQRAVLRFLGIVSDRRHLPVRILDLALRIEHLIHAIRCGMDDLQFLTLRGEQRNLTCWLGQFSYFDGGQTGKDTGRPILEEWQ